MKRNINNIVLSKSLLYVSASIGISEMLSSKESILSIILGVICMISLVYDLNTW